MDIYKGDNDHTSARDDDRSSGRDDDRSSGRDKTMAVSLNLLSMLINN